jgi:hypothetical protein
MPIQKSKDDETSSVEPKDVHSSRIKSVATLVAAITALITALGAYMKPQDNSVNKESYETLSGIIVQLSEQNQKNHDDITALRGYVEALARNTPVTIATIDSVGGLGSGTIKTVPSSTPKTSYFSAPNPSTSASGTSQTKISEKNSEALTISASKMYELPSLSTSSKPAKPPAFDDVLHSAAKK